MTAGAAATAVAGDGAGAAAAGGRRAVPALAAEILALLLAPVACFWALRLRAMAVDGLPDPAMHSVYLWDPRDLVVRYAPQVFSAARLAYIGPPAAYFRWGTRPGFLVPGRLAYLAFGAVPGFFAFRYVLALVATVPAYVLAKRLWGRSAGALAVVLVMSSPVIVTAWGTDFPDSAAVSYLLGATACLVIPPRSRREHRLLLVLAGALYTASVWSLATTGLLVAVTILVWAGYRAARDRRHLAGDVALLAGVAVATTVALAVGSWVLLGRFDFVAPTIRAVLFLGTPAQEKLWHSGNPRWAPYDAYLLVLPAVVAAWAATVRVRPAGRRGEGAARPAHRAAPADPAADQGTPAGHTAHRAAQVVLGLTATGQLVLAAYFQFVGKVQLLEEHYLSSTLWAASTLTLLVVLAEIARPLAARRVLRFVPAAAVVVVALLSEVLPTPPPLGWEPWGFVLVAVVAGVVAGVAFLAGAPLPGRLLRPAIAAMASVVVLAAVLVLTVAPTPEYTPLPNAVYDPLTGYDQALGGAAGRLVDEYRIEYEARRWVPNATYRGEQLLTCLTDPSSAREFKVAALFHAGDNMVPGTCPRISDAAVDMIARRKAAQLLVVSKGRLHIGELLHRLAPLGAVLARHTELRAGRVTCWLWLVEMPRYLSDHAI